LTADKVGLETTLQSKNATIDDLGINLNNTQLEHQRMAMVANHNLVVAENTFQRTPYIATGLHHPSSTYLTNPVVGANLASPVKVRGPGFPGFTPYGYGIPGVNALNGPLTTDSLSRAYSPKK